MQLVRLLCNYFGCYATSWVATRLLPVVVIILLTARTNVVEDISVWTLTPVTLTLIVTLSAVQTAASFVAVVIIWLTIHTCNELANRKSQIRIQTNKSM